jgi:hypothetical protein
MKGAVYWCGALTVAVCAVAGGARAETRDVTDQDRVWANFTREAAVVGANRFWIELRGMKLSDDQGGPALGLNGYPVNDFEKAKGKTIDNIDGGRFDLIGAYGLGPRWEFGTDFAFVTQQQISFTDGTLQSDTNIGDLLLYGKFKEVLAEHWAGALGLEMSIPTGDRKKMLGSGELGLNPILSTRYQSGRVAIGGHLGFLLNTNSQPDVFNWSVEGIVRGTDLFALRVEVNGRLFNEFGGTFNDIAVYPGIDFNLTDNFIIRPEGLAHLTNDAIDWGLGIGFVFTI